MKRSRIIGGIAAVAVSALMLAGCSAGSSGSTSAASGGSKTLTLAAVSAIAHFEQALIGGGQDEVYWRAVYGTLLTRDTKDVLKPDLAESWSYNSDNTVLTLKLRKGMKFDDGTPITSADAVASMNNMKNGTGPDRVRFTNATFSAPDDLTVVATLKAPDPAFTDYLSFDTGTVVEAKYLTAADAGSNPHSSGPYTLDASKTTIGSQYTFERNKNYWDPKSYPYDTVVIKVLPDVTSRLNALKSGQVDAGALNGATAAEAKASGLHYITQLGGMDGLQIRDTTGASVPALGSQQVRQAMNMVFDREAIVKNLLHGFGQPTDQQFINSSEAFIKDGETQYKFDVAAAKKLMAEGGYPDGFDLTMPTESSQTFINPTIQEALGSIGIKVTFETVPDTQWVTKMITGSYPVYFQGASSRTARIDLESIHAAVG